MTGSSRGPLATNLGFQRIGRRRELTWALEAYWSVEHDTAVLVGAVPPRYGWSGEEPVGLDTYFARARGRPSTGGDGGGVQALPMTKWFDTNDRYLVPELRAD